MKAVSKIFGVSNSLPERPRLSFTPKEILEDIQLISSNEQFVDKLYLCVNEKPATTHLGFVKLEDFLLDTRKLETASNNVNILTDDTCLLRTSLSECISKLKDTTN